jgi:hypothetical protein
MAAIGSLYFAFALGRFRCVIFGHSVPGTARLSRGRGVGYSPAAPPTSCSPQSLSPDGRNRRLDARLACWRQPRDLGMGHRDGGDRRAQPGSVRQGEGRRTLTPRSSQLPPRSAMPPIGPACRLLGRFTSRADRSSAIHTQLWKAFTFRHGVGARDLSEVIASPDQTHHLLAVCAAPCPNPFIFVIVVNSAAIRIPFPGRRER